MTHPKHLVEWDAVSCFICCERAETFNRFSSWFTDIHFHTPKVRERTSVSADKTSARALNLQSTQFEEWGVGEVSRAVIIPSPYPRIANIGISYPTSGSIGLDSLFTLLSTKALDNAFAAAFWSRAHPVSFDWHYCGDRLALTLATYNEHILSTLDIALSALRTLEKAESDEVPPVPVCPLHLLPGKARILLRCADSFSSLRPLFGCGSLRVAVCSQSCSPMLAKQICLLEPTQNIFPSLEGQPCSILGGNSRVSLAAIAVDTDRISEQVSWWPDLLMHLVGHRYGLLRNLNEDISLMTPSVLMPSGLLSGMRILYAYTEPDRATSALRYLRFVLDYVSSSRTTPTEMRRALRLMDYQHSLTRSVPKTVARDLSAWLLDGHATD